METVELHFYKNPASKSRRDYLLIGPERLHQSVPGFAGEYAAAIVAVGPMYKRVTVRLSERMQRELMVQQVVAAQQQADSNPLELKPNIGGFGVDLHKLWAWVRRLIHRKGA